MATPPMKSLLLLGASLACVPLSRADIVWSAATNVSTDADISTLGTLIDAYNFGVATSYTINGVTFAGVTTGTGSTAGWGGTLYTGYGTTTLPLANISGNYASALSSGDYFSTANQPFSTNIQGLTAGHTYLLQVWLNTSNPGANTMTWSSGGSSTSVTLNGGGQYAIGQFTVDSGTTQSVRFQPDSHEGATVNLYQLRDITAVPEPATYGLLGAGSLATLAFVRRRRNRG